MKILSDLVKIDSVSGNEAKIALFIKNHLTALGLDPLMQEGNVIAQIKGKNTQKALIFNAHMDTVPPGSISLWNTPPYGEGSGQNKNNHIYGLGASDDKSGIASLLLLAKELTVKQPKLDVWLTFVTREEIDGYGTKTFIQWFTTKGYLKGYDDLSAIICEPTDLEEIKIGHRGNIFVKITIHGDGGHGSKPHLIKINAITQTYKVIKKVEELSSLWQKEYKHAILGAPSVSITTITGGDPLSPNKFADSCSLTLDIRTTPKLHNNVLTLLKNHLKDIKPTIEFLYEPTSFGNTDPKADIVLKTHQITGAKITINVGSNDLCFFTEANIPGIVFGPGKHVTIHKANEYCEIKKVKKSVTIYKKLVY